MSILRLRKIATTVFILFYTQHICCYPNYYSSFSKINNSSKISFEIIVLELLLNPIAFFFLSNQAFEQSKNYKSHYCDKDKEDASIHAK